VGQDEMKLALLLNVISPAIGGVLIMGHRGTGKSTAVRALAELLPMITVVRGCAYNCDANDRENLCHDCEARLSSGERLSSYSRAVAVVDLPLGATEDRVTGTIDIERALNEGAKSFEPGLLARANRGFLYIDEVNLLEDHLVDLLLDAAADGRSKVEREGISIEHPSRFVLVGSGNPEEGELRPQFLDRFGTCVEVETILDPEARVRIVELREAFDKDSEAFLQDAESELADLRRRLVRAKRNLDSIVLPRELLLRVAQLCVQLNVDGHRGELTIARAARALAALEGRKKVSESDIKRVVGMCLRHRLRRDPLERVEATARIERAIEDTFGETAPRDSASTDDQSSPASDAFTDDEGGHTRPRPRRQTNNRTDEVKRSAEDAKARAFASEVALLPDSLTETPGVAREPASPTRPGRSRGLKRTSYGRRGRYSGSSREKSETGRVAIDATIRAVSVARRGRGTSRVGGSDLRYKRLRSKAGTLYIFAIDTSGSMAHNRIQHAKGAVLELLKRSYVNRDQVALVCFRGASAEVALSPSSSPVRAGRILEAQPVGGATPLASALMRSLELARKAVEREAKAIVLMLFTDGRGNVSLGDCRVGDRQAVRELLAEEVKSVGAALQRAGVESIVVDTSKPFIAGDEGPRIAAALGGRYLRLPQITRPQDSIRLLER
jgi:magnesium chelatase subunit D